MQTEQLQYGAPVHPLRCRDAPEHSRHPWSSTLHCRIESGLGRSADAFSGPDYHPVRAWYFALLLTLAQPEELHEERGLSIE